MCNLSNIRNKWEGRVEVRQNILTAKRPDFSQAICITIFYTMQKVCTTINRNNLNQNKTTWGEYLKFNYISNFKFGYKTNQPLKDTIQKASFPFNVRYCIDENLKSCKLMYVLKYDDKLKTLANLA